MLIQLMANCDPNETGSVSTEITREAKKRNWTPDPFFLGILNKLELESNNLEYSTGTVYKFSYTDKLRKDDTTFNQTFLQTKHLITASTYSQDPIVAKNAREVMNTLEAHDANLYRLGHGKQIFLSFSLLNDYKSADMKPKVDSLLGVPEALISLEEITIKMDATYQESKTEKASLEKILPPSAQKDIVRDFINTEVLPYLYVMRKKDPENYKEFCDLVFKYIEDANTTVKSRLTRNANQVEVNQEEN